MKTEKFKTVVWPQKGVAIHPVIEAKNTREARLTIKALFSDAKLIGAVIKTK
ncbi:MAG: hypothetical protein WCT05_16565 [Lentisphaeria bacterium]